MSLPNYENDNHSKFVEDMEINGLDVTHYRGRNFYEGPCVNVSEAHSLQDIIRLTDVELNWESLGLGLVIWPV